MDGQQEQWMPHKCHIMPPIGLMRYRIMVRK